jgi:multiple sugar transport system ATP-binding protein
LGKHAGACGATRLLLDVQKARLLDETRRRRVWVGIRPERLEPAAGAPAPGRIALSGVVEVVEMLGAEQHVHVEIEGFELTARIPRDRPVRAGETVTLATKACHLHLFDHESGEALRAPARPGAAAAG